MSIFGNIVSKIFGTHAQAAPSAGGGSGAPSGTSSAPGNAGAGSATASTGAQAGSQVDAEKVLSDLAAKNSQTLDWKHSIVDMLKLLDMDSSLDARKKLADELHYTGDKSDSATMNVWLSKQVMKQLAEHGGKMPDDLKHA